MRRALFVLVALLVLSVFAIPRIEAVAPTGWTEFNEPGVASNTWLAPSSTRVTFEGDGSCCAATSYLINDALVLTDLRFTGKFVGLADGVNTAVGIVTHWADVDNYTAFFIFEGSGGVARIVRTSGTGTITLHELDIAWQDNFEFDVEIRVFNDTMLVNMTDADGVDHVLAGSIPTAQLGFNQMGFFASPIAGRGMMEWRQFFFTSYTNPKDVVVEDTTNHVAFPSGYFNGTNLTVVYREGAIHNLDTAARLMQANSSDQGDTWSSPSVWLDIAIQDEREVTFLTLANGTILAVTNEVNSTEQQVVTLFSTDNGDTWSSPQQIGNFLGETQERLGGYPIQVRNGTVLMPLYDVDGAIQPSWVVRSTDIITWTVLGQLDSSPSEWTIAELRNETLWADIRGPASAWYYSFSTDGGVTWDPIRQQGNISQFYNGVNAFPAFLQLASGNIFVGHRAQLEATSAGLRSRINMALLLPSVTYASYSLVVLDAYDRVGEGHIDDYGYADIIQISDGRYYFIWYDNSTSSIEGRLVIEPELAARQVTGIWTVVTNTIGIESFTQYSGIVYDNLIQTTMQLTLTAGASVDIVVTTWDLTQTVPVVFTATADSGTRFIVTIPGLQTNRLYDLRINGTVASTPRTGTDGTLSFTHGSFSTVSFSLTLVDESASWQRVLPPLFLGVFLFGFFGMVAFTALGALKRVFGRD